MIRSMLDQANGGLRELSLSTPGVSTGQFADVVPSGSYRVRVVESVTASKPGTAGAIWTSVRNRPDSVLELPIPRNQFEVLVVGEYHRLDICTILVCELEKGRTDDQGMEQWTSRLAVPLEPELFRESEVSAFLLKELGRFLDIVDGELKRRLGSGAASQGR